ncbi:hypothetical protein BDQ12DRAFT_655223 [Crucibulum laeve]|uniref:Small ribosomal subunit protein uS10m n=1 Tax=Crucibulum laeve TaxID=68775 RepID=A0A5C3LSW2_9AGAR|nr:hypothetical protein BDQ12DRAFT_655223 [Crucibulum laeve]
MLRLALARSSRRYAPGTARCRRFNSTQPGDKPGKPEASAHVAERPIQERPALSEEGSKPNKTGPTASTSSLQKPKEADIPRADADLSVKTFSTDVEHISTQAATAPKAEVDVSVKEAVQSQVNANVSVKSSPNGVEVQPSEAATQYEPLVDSMAPTPEVEPELSVKITSMESAPTEAADAAPLMEVEVELDSQIASANAAEAAQDAGIDVEVDLDSLSPQEQAALAELVNEALPEPPSQVVPADYQSTGIFDTSSSHIPGTNGLDPRTLPRRVNLEESDRPVTEEDYAATLVHGRAIHMPFIHPRTNGIPVANLHFRSHHPQLLDLFTHFASHAASALKIPISRVVYLPTQRSMWTVLRSPFAYKKSQENFERRVHKRAIKAWDADPEVVDRWVQYLRKHALGGVGMRVTKWERASLSIGKTTLAHVKESLDTPDDKIKALGEQIIRDELLALSQKENVAPPA